MVKLTEDDVEIIYDTVGSVTRSFRFNSGIFTRNDCQEAFRSTAGVLLHRAERLWDPKLPLRPYIVAAASQELKKFCNRAQKRASHERYDARLESDELPSREHVCSPDTVAEANEVRQRVTQAIAALPLHMAPLVCGKYGIGRTQASTRELAIEFGISEITVRRKLAAAKVRLRVLLAGLAP